MANPKLLIVGCGITGATIAHLLAQCSVKISVWEASLAVGGRMQTHAALGGSTDTGAQYISRGAGGAPPSEAALAALDGVYDELLGAGVLRPLTATVRGVRPSHHEQTHYVAPAGLASMASHLSRRAEVSLGRSLKRLRVGAGGNGWLATSGDGAEESFDAVVLTAPVPQLLAIEGDVRSTLGADLVRDLGAVQYSARFALAAYFAPEADAVLDGLPWAATYVAGEERDIVCFVAADARKRGLAAGEATPSLLAHTSVPWGIENMGRDDEEVKAAILADVDRLVPGLPEPLAVELVRWRQSQVRDPLPDPAGGAAPAYALKLLGRGAAEAGASARAPLFVAGDMLSGSNFENTVASAHRVRELFLDEGQ